MSSAASPGAVARSGPESIAPTGHHAGLAKLVLMATGVVFGDIGTSPLYAIKECVDAEHGVAHGKVLDTGA